MQSRQPSCILKPLALPTSGCGSDMKVRSLLETQQCMLSGWVLRTCQKAVRECSGVKRISKHLGCHQPQPYFSELWKPKTRMLGCGMQAMSLPGTSIHICIIYENLLGASTPAHGCKTKAVVPGDAHCQQKSQISVPYRQCSCMGSSTWR